MSNQPHDRGDLFASIALLVSGPLLGVLTVFTTGTVPLQILAFGLILFGLFSYAGTAGLEKPLIRMMCVALLFCAYGFLTLKLGGDTQSQINAGVLYLLSLFMGIFIWGVALVHRPGKAKQIGIAGLMFGLGPLTLLVLGHIVLGFGGAIGVQAIWSAQASGQLGDTEFLNIGHICLGLWALASAAILRAKLLRQ